MAMTKLFVIGTIADAKGGRIGVCRLPGLDGDLASDLKTIVDWAPQMVVSMTERLEMEQCSSGDLGSLLSEAGIDWFHLPIRDFSGPDGEGKAAWPKLAERLHRILDDGGAVLLHCKGGKGRSGMIALRLLVERGLEAGAALAAIRHVVPGAVETQEQAQWASGEAIARAGLHV
jgi:hypothetical protein